MKYKKAIAIRMLVLMILGLFAFGFLVWFIFQSQAQGSEILGKIGNIFS